VVDEDAFGAFAEGAFLWDADFVDPGTARCRLDCLDQPGTFAGERVSGQHGAGIDDQEQEPVIL
jgi:hypothetical protein